MKSITILSLLCLTGWFFFIREASVRYGPGIFAPNDPIQKNLKYAASFPFKGYSITPLAEFTLKAKVLSKENYRFDRESDISPVDLALGWQAMSDERILDKIDISQSGRWYQWWTRNFPIPRREIESNSANMHIIPANEAIEATLRKVRKGDIIALSGQLVQVEADDGWHWVSSLSRADTGNGACEIVFVEHLMIESF